MGENGEMNPRIEWLEAGQQHSARWRSEAAIAPHGKIVIGDDRLGADAAWRLINDGTAILWRGDWQNARKLMLTLTTRADRLPRTGKRPASAAESFAQHRQTQGRRAALLALLLHDRLDCRIVPEVGRGIVGIGQINDAGAMLANSFLHGWQIQLKIWRQVNADELEPLQLSAHGVHHKAW